MSKRTASHGLGSLASGAVTALATAIQNGFAAVVGIVIAREFGRTAETDGFFAAYGVYIVLVLAAMVVRLVVLPSLARARDQRRLGSETAAWALALGLVAGPLLLVGILTSGPIATLLTGFGPEASRDAAAETLPLLLVAAVGQLYAGLAASALAALDSYAVAAVSFIVGSAVGLGYILVRVGEDGITAVAVGMALNALFASGLQVAVLWLRARREVMPAGAVRPTSGSLGKRLGEAAAGITLPLALQAVYLVCLPFASREGVGAVTTFGYAFLAGSALVAVCASSIGLVTSVPLTRGGDLDESRVTRHVVSSSWPAVVVVGAIAGAFALAGSTLVSAALGDGYVDRVGEELGLLIASFAPWMVASIGYSLTLPLVFVARRGSRLPLLGIVVLVLQVPLAWLGQAAAGLTGLALTLAVTTAFALTGMLRTLHAVRGVLTGLALAGLLVGALSVAAFGASALLLDHLAAAIVGLLVYVVLLVLMRPAPLVASLRYLRSI